MIVRAFLALFAAASATVAQPTYDILIKGGHVIDPKNNFDAIADVAVAGGKIARVARNIPPESARKTIDVTGLYVTPGLIDIHAHMWNRPGAGPPGRNLSFMTAGIGVHPAPEEIVEPCPLVSPSASGPILSNSPAEGLGGSAERALRLHD